LTTVPYNDIYNMHWRDKYISLIKSDAFAVLQASLSPVQVYVSHTLLFISQDMRLHKRVIVLALDGKCKNENSLLLIHSRTKGKI